MSAYAVWETEYPNEGSVLVVRQTEKGARRWYRKATCERSRREDLTPLSVSRLTASEALALHRSGEI